MTKTHINEILIGILKSKTLTQFSAVDLKKMLIEQIPGTTNKQASQMVHKTLNKLCHINFLEKYKDGRKACFTKTALFDETRLQVIKPRGQSITSIKVGSETDKLQKLKEALDQYQTNLFGYIGEAEEFKRLFNELPEAKPSLYSRYMYAQNQSSSMEGKIKALEACICILEN